MLIECPECNWELSSQARFCTRCGHLFSQQELHWRNEYAANIEKILRERGSEIESQVSTFMVVFIFWLVVLFLLLLYLIGIL